MKSADRAPSLRILPYNWEKTRKNLSQGSRRMPVGTMSGFNHYDRCICQRGEIPFYSEEVASIFLRKISFFRPYWPKSWYRFRSITFGIRTRITKSEKYRHDEECDVSDVCYVTEICCGQVTLWTSTHIHLLCLTLNIPSLGRQRCLPSWGPRRAPWFFVISQLFDAVDYSDYVFWDFWNYNSVIQALLVSNILCLFISTEVSQ